jgi:hypothetical protein
LKINETRLDLFTSERTCAPCVVLVIDNNHYGLMFALSFTRRFCP